MNIPKSYNTVYYNSVLPSQLCLDNILFWSFSLSWKWKKKKISFSLGLKQEQNMKQNLIITMHINSETFTQSIYLWDPLKNEINPKNHNHLFVIRKHIFPVYSAALKDQEKRDKKEKLTEIDISWYSSVYKRNVILSKPNQKLSIFSLGIYYFFYSIQSIFKYFFKVMWQLYSVLKWKRGFYHTWPLATALLHGS